MRLYFTKSPKHTFKNSHFNVFDETNFSQQKPMMKKTIYFEYSTTGLSIRNSKY